MAFGKRSGKDDSDDTSRADAVDAPSGDELDDEVEGPFDIDDFDDPSVAELARLATRRNGRDRPVSAQAREAQYEAISAWGVPDTSPRSG